MKEMENILNRKIQFRENSGNCIFYSHVFFLYLNEFLMDMQVNGVFRKCIQHSIEVGALTRHVNGGIHSEYVEYFLIRFWISTLF